MDSFGGDYTRIVTEKSEVASGSLIEMAGRSWRVERLLGRGKGGYSWLVTGRKPVGQAEAPENKPAPAPEYSAVLKQLHHEPCEYYSFGDKFKSEMNDYAKLCALGVPLPEMYASDRNRELILKEYIDGESAMELARRNAVTPGQIGAVGALSSVLRASGINIDWYPTNFIVRKTDGAVFYIDYECNPFDEKWSFETWGIKYWIPAELQSGYVVDK